MRELKGFVVTQHFDSLSADQFPHRRQDTKPEDVREFLDAKKKSKIDLVIFQDKCKKTTQTHIFFVQFIFDVSFFLGEGGYFWEFVVGLHRLPHLIFTLFESNICRANVREFLPRDKTDKGMSWGMCSLQITM